MIVTRKENLKIVAKYIDKNNPKEELNYLYVDEENIVATDTRALGTAKHYIDETNDEFEPFLIHKSIVDVALKQTKAKYFELSRQKIICYDEDNNEIIVISKNDFYIENFNYPKYENIIPEYIDKSIPFTQCTQIDGILALNKICINPIYIPEVNKNGKDDFGGYVKINDRNLPIVIQDKNKNFTVVIMPIIDTFSAIFNDE